MDDNKGTLLLLLQTKHGAQLLDQVGNCLAMKEVSCEELSQQNTDSKPSWLLAQFELEIFVCLLGVTSKNLCVYLYFTALALIISEVF